MFSWSLRYGDCGEEKRYRSYLSTIQHEDVTKHLCRDDEEEPANRRNGNSDILLAPGKTRDWYKGAKGEYRHKSRDRLGHCCRNDASLQILPNPQPEETRKGIPDFLLAIPSERSEAKELNVVRITALE